MLEWIRETRSIAVLSGRIATSHVAISFKLITIT